MAAAGAGDSGHRDPAGIYLYPAGWVCAAGDARGAGQHEPAWQLGQGDNPHIGAEPQTVRSGTYQPRQIDLLAKQGVDWYRLYSSGPWGQLGTIEVKPEETTVLQPGPPLTLKADVNRRGRNVSIGFTIVGRAGEEYETVVKNGKRTPAPMVKFVDSGGKTLGSGKFEYG